MKNETHKWRKNLRTPDFGSNSLVFYTNGFKINEGVCSGDKNYINRQKYIQSNLYKYHLIFSVNWRVIWHSKCYVSKAHRSENVFLRQAQMKILFLHSHFNLPHEPLVSATSMVNVFTNKLNLWNAIIRELGMKIWRPIIFVFLKRQTNHKA